MKFQTAGRVITVAVRLQTRTYRELASVWVITSSISMRECSNPFGISMWDFARHKRAGEYFALGRPEGNDSQADRY